MASLTAVHNIGESIVQLLRNRRGILAAENRLGPIPTAGNILQIDLSKLSGTPPTAELALTCYHIGYSEHTQARTMSRDVATTHGISLELSYLVSSWSSNAAIEAAHISWAMLELSRYPTLDRSMLIEPDSWDRDESLQIVPDNLAPEQIFRLWDALKMKHRLSALFRVRVVRLGYGPVADAPPVVASRLSFAHGDVSTASEFA
jgi:Pvc16 N-terminal domain